MNARVDRRTFLGLLGASAGTLAFGLSRGAAQQPPVSGGRRAIVLGAGLSGLYTARLLEAQGWDVTVLEARLRVGGRVFSQTGELGRVEWGGQVLTSTYRRAMALCKDLSVATEVAQAKHGPRGACLTCHKGQPELVEKVGSGSTLYVSGRLMREGDWKSQATGVGPAEKAIVPARLLGSYLSAGNPLEDTEAWIRPAHADLDAISVAEYVTKRGASPEGLRLMGVAPNCRSLQTASALWALRDDQRRKSLTGLPVQIQGGNSLLPQAMAAALRTPVRTGAVVTDIASIGQEIVVRCADGTTCRGVCCVSSLPLPALSRVAMSPLPGAVQAEAIRAIAYTSITLVVLKVLKPFWLDDNQSASMWTDSPIERIFPLRNAAGEVSALTCFVDGEAAERLDAMDERVRHAFVVDELVRMRPAAKGAVQAVGSVCWGREAFSGGSYQGFTTGQITRLRPSFAEPVGRLHFAGEHTAVSSPGMEGALESAERAVAEVAARYAPGATGR